MPLYATLPPNDVKQLRTIIQNSTALPPITPKTLFNEIQNNGTHSHYFPPLNNLFNYLFGDNNQTNTIQTCLENLNLCLPNFVNHPFPSYQIFALTSLMQATNGQPPSTLQTSIAYMLESNNPPAIYDLAPMMVICEYSNPNFDLNLQNTLLGIGAVFHGNTNATNLDVHLPYRQEQRLLAANPNKEIPIFGGPVKWGIPIGEFQDDFEGFSEVVTVPNMNPSTSIPAPNDTVIFGTPNADTLTLAGLESDYLSSPVVYGGIGNDHLIHKIYGGYIYVSGNIGEDIYEITKGDTIYDSDGKGKIYLNQYISPTPASLSGPIIDEYICDTEVSRNCFKTTFKSESDGSTSLILANSFSSLPSLRILAYKTGQLGIWPETKSHPLKPKSFDYPLVVAGAATSEHLMLSSPYQVNLYMANGTFTRQLNLTNIFSIDCYGKPTIADHNNNFRIIGIPKNTCQFTELTINPFNYTHQFRIIDQVTSFNCSTITQPAYLTLTPTDATNQDFAAIYLKPEDNFGNRGLYVRINSTDKIIRVDSISNNTLITRLYAGPTHNGFLINYGPYDLKSTTLELDNLGNLLNKYKSSKVALFGTRAFANGYLALYATFDTPSSQPSFFTQIFSKNKWSPSTQLPHISDQACNQKVTVQALAENRTLILSQNENYILNSKNEIEIQSFQFAVKAPCSPSPVSFFGTTILANGDTSIVYDVCQEQQRVVTLPTSYLSQKLQQQTITPKPTAIPTLTTTKQVTAETTTSAPLFQTGNWSPDIEYHPQTGEPVFTFEARNSANKVIGTAKFYGQPLLCTGKDGKGHNLIETTGIFSDFEIQPEMNIEEVCRVLPPSLFESTVMKIQAGAYEGLQQGAMRGGANVFGYTLRSAGVSEKVAGYLSELTYYSGFFLLRFNSHLIEADYLSAMLQAAIDTGNLLLVSAVIQATTNLLDYAGNQLSQTYKEAGNLVKGASALIGRLGIFAWNAIRQDPVATTTQIITGALTQTAVETVGTYVVDQFKPQETTYSPSMP